MKKYTLALVLMAILPMFDAVAYNRSPRRSSSYSAAQPVSTSTYKNTTASRRTGGHVNTIQNNFYYTGNTSYYNGNNRTYKSYRPNYEYMPETRSVSERSYPARSSQMRKFFLAHPFFQPLKGKFGSVTDVSYSKNAFNFDVLDGKVLDIDPTSSTYNTVIASGNVGISGKQETSQFAVKEDFSVGLSDTLAIVGMAQYDKTKIKFKDWSDESPSDDYSDSGLNIFGAGLQYRFVDNDEWIAMMAGFFQHQKDTANTLIGELKVGYKVARTTLYGLGRLGYSDLIEGDTYGAFVKAADGDWLMLSYNTGIKDVLYVEGGVGAFAVLNKYFTLNGELIYGHYDWHQQMSIKGAIGCQPGDMFALNLYASTSLYDNAKNKVNKYMNYDVNPVGVSSDLVYTTGEYKIKDYNEWKIGVQAILYF